jgi:hypothetical protein
MVAQRLRKFPEPKKMDHRLVADRAKKTKRDGEYWQFAQGLCEHWNIAAITA